MYYDVWQISIELIKLIITASIASVITHLLTKKRISDQLEKSFMYERKAKYNDLEIEHLLNLYSELAKETTAAFYRNKVVIEYFEKAEKDINVLNTSKWDNEFKDFDERTGMNLLHSSLPDIAKYLIFSEDLSQEYYRDFEVGNTKKNIVKLSTYINQNRPNELYELFKNQQKVDIIKVEELKDFRILYERKLYNFKNMVARKILMLREENIKRDYE